MTKKKKKAEKEHVSKIKSVLEYNESVDVVLIFFVGAFDGNAFAAPYGENRIAVCLPIENGENQVVPGHKDEFYVEAQEGWSFSDIARIREEDMASALVKYI